jgi:hypothetical protein
MQTIEDQIRALKTNIERQEMTLRRQRSINIALTGIIAAGAFVGAVRPAGDATFDTITCKRWRVLDKDGRERIVAKCSAEGDADLCLLDTNGKKRIFALVSVDGSTDLAFTDKVEKMRIDIGTDADSNAVVALHDKSEKLRLQAGAFADGIAGVTWFDNAETGRILMRTFANADCGIDCLDKNERKRIAARTYGNGMAGLAVFDTDEKRRIEATTSGPDTDLVRFTLNYKDESPRILSGISSDGTSAVALCGENGKTRVRAATLPNGGVLYPTRDGK